MFLAVAARAWWLFQLCQIALGFFPESAEATRAAELYLLSFVLENVGLAMRSELRPGDNANVERVRANWRGFRRGFRLRFPAAA